MTILRIMWIVLAVLNLISASYFLPGEHTFLELIGLTMWFVGIMMVCITGIATGGKFGIR